MLNFEHLFSLPSEFDYLCGHSLGIQPNSTAKAINSILNEWKEGGVECFGRSYWGIPWLKLEKIAISKISPLIGASADEISVSGTCTLNIHSLLAVFLSQNHQERCMIVVQEKEFPSDMVIVKFI
jgi:kynureninase